MSKVPSLDDVVAALHHKYESEQFDWLYEDLFAELMGCSPRSSFAQQAQRLMRREHPAFQRRANVIAAGGRIYPQVVVQQARAALAMCERGLKEGWLAGARERPSAAGCPDPVQLTLSWHGPFGFLRLPGVPLVFDQPESASPGLYLWTVELADGHLVAYVGKTDRSFSERLEEEVDLHLGGQDGFWDPDLYARGVRRRIERPMSGVREHLQQVLQCCRVFIAPLSVSPALLLRVESGVIRHLRSAGGRSQQFLGNRHCRGASGPAISVHTSSAVPLIGLVSDFEA
jgi:hypothetical protein